jgi:hypothetical protein
MAPRGAPPSGLDIPLEDLFAGLRAAAQRDGAPATHTTANPPQSRETARTKLGPGCPGGFHKGHITVKSIQCRLPPAAHPAAGNAGLNEWVEALLAFTGELLPPPTRKEKKAMEDPWLTLMANRSGANHSTQAEAPAPKRVALAEPQPAAAQKAPLAAQPPKFEFAGMVPRRFAKAAAPTAAPPVANEGGKNNNNPTRRGAATAAAAAATAATLAQPLPVHAHMPAILSAISRRRLTCIRGETGCGKSSEIPLAIVRDAFAKGGDAARDVNVIVTQPRRLAARALASRVASLLGEAVGETCGYRVGNGGAVQVEFS